LSEEKKYRNYTAGDIEKYRKGLLSAKEMNELEKAALDDPFLADALEGYGATPVNISADLSELEKKLQKRISGAKVVSMVSPGNSFKWWKVAAAVLVIGAVGFFTYRLSTNGNNNDVAQLEKQKKSNEQPVTPVIDSNKLSTQEATGIADSNKEMTTTITSAASKKNKTTTFFNTATDTIHNDFAANTSAPADLTSNNKEERNDSTVKLAGAVASSESLAKSKKSEQNNKQSEGYAATQQKAVELRDQEKINYFRGRVVDANNNPLPFANITNTRDNVGTYADAKGNFTLISPDSTLDVQVRSVGFENNLAQLKNNVTSNQVTLQEDKVSPDKIISYKKPDTSRYRKANIKFEEPEPADGWSNYGVYLANNTKVPDDLKKEEHDGGQVQISFEVNQNGNPVNLRVEKSLCQKCDEEAVRLVKEGPKWKKKNNKTKRVTITVPFDD
jgi:TonB family protein